MHALPASTENPLIAFAYRYEVWVESTDAIKSDGMQLVWGVLCVIRHGNTFTWQWNSYLLYADNNFTQPNTHNLDQEFWV